jgi:GT2 family glycosyltransferase/glycosyltransferase involved in cell wall biosynthesis
MNHAAKSLLSAPWARLDEDWYFARYGAHPALAGDEDDTSFYHAITAGEGRSPNPFFDESWYVDVFQDVAGLIAAGRVASGFAHYVTEGYLTRSPHWLFSESYYRVANRDITQSVLETGGFSNGYDHFLRAGDRQARQGSLYFDPRLYVRHFLLGRRQDPVSPFVHFLRNNGRNEFQKPFSWYFDPGWYLAAYQAVTPALQATSYLSPLEHYLRNLTPQKFNPSRFFSEEYYMAAHPDIAQAVAAGSFRNAYDHFIQYGVFELRNPHPEVNLERYFKNVAVQRDIENGLFRDAFGHFAAHAERLRPRRRDEVAEAGATALYASQAASTATAWARRRINFTLAGPPDISVVMRLGHEIEHDLKTLDSLAKTAGALEVDLALVNPLPGTDTRLLRKMITGARILDLTWNLGFAAGANAAIGQASAPAILFLQRHTVIEADSVRAALERLFSAPDIGAVGGRMLQANGVLASAGEIIWRDGTASSYLRGRDPNDPEANFTRDTDACAPAFWLVRTSALQALEGFDAHFATVDFALADLAIRLAAAGFRSVHDPAVITTCFADPSDAKGSIKAQEMDLAWLHQKHPEFLAGQPRRLLEAAPQARHPAHDTRPRVLFIEDRIPFRHLGTGYTRAHDIIRALVRTGCHVTLFPIYRAVESLLKIAAEFPDEVEIIHDRELPDLPAFLQGRQDYYDLLWLSRTPNAGRVLSLLRSAGISQPARKMVLDTEAVTILRNRLKDEIFNRPAPAETLSASIAAELRYAGAFDTIVAVNPLEADLIGAAGFHNVKILGHAQSLHLTGRPFADRHGLLFVGALSDRESPNLDSLIWFIERVLPQLALQLPAETRFTVAGYVNRRIDLSGLARVKYVDLRGPQEDLTPLYDEHRLFIAPTRFAAGIPYKLHEAAAHGLPIVASALLARQLGWQDEAELLTADPAAPETFVSQIARLYHDPALWEQIRAQAADRMARENSPGVYDETLREILRILG